MKTICLTRIDILIRNGKINKKNSVYHELIDETLVACPHYSQNEMIQATILSKLACDAYDMFVKKHPNSRATILIKLSYFVKCYQLENGDVTNVSYAQVDIQFIQCREWITENLYLDITKNFQTIIYNILCDLNLYCQKDKSTFNPQHMNKWIVFRNKAAAILIHEFSHLFEADIYLYSRNFINNINPFIELNDIFHHALLPDIFLGVDDEFSPNRDINIIENGAVKNILVDRKWSQIYRCDLYGNGRRTFQENSIILPRIRISQMKHESTISIDKVTNEIKDCFIIDNIKSARLNSKEGTVIFQVNSAQYHHGDKTIYHKPFSIQCSIMEIINNIACVSKDNYYAVYPCGKNGYQLPCGVVTPSNIFIKGGNLCAL